MSNHNSIMCCGKVHRLVASDLGSMTSLDVDLRMQFIPWILLVVAVLFFSVIWHRKMAAVAAAEAELQSTIADGKTQVAVLSERATRAESELSDRESTIAIKDKHLSEQRDALARMEEKVRAHEEFAVRQEETLKNAQSELEKAFKALAQEAIQANSTQFLELANERLTSLSKETEKDLEERQKSIEQLVKPLSESLGKLSDETRDLEKKRHEDYGNLSAQVKQVAEVSLNLGKETRSLAQALRNPAQRGTWGEIQLRRVVEMAGMKENCDFETQVTRTTDEGGIRPDMVINMPHGRRVVVDAKVPFEAYSNALAIDDATQRTDELKRHARQVRQHVQKLGNKNYHQQFSESPDFVILFIPAEPMVAAAFDHDADIFDFGVRNGVIIASPMTLIAILKAFALSVRQEKLEENAKRIGELGKDLYRKFGTLANHLSKLGRSLNSSVTDYNAVIGSIEGSILPQARKFKELDATTAGEIEEMSPVDTRSRAIQSPELKAALPKPALPKESLPSLFETN